MRIRLLNLRFEQVLGGFDDRPLDELLAGRELIEIREHFFVTGGVPRLVCLVAYSEAQETNNHMSPRKAHTLPQAPGVAAIPVSGPAGSCKQAKPRSPKPDPLQELDEAQRLLFQTLREWRSDTAKTDGVPPYVVMTNRELVAVIQRLPNNATALGEVKGIGKGKVERYGVALLAKLRGASANTQPGTQPDLDPPSSNPRLPEVATEVEA